MRLVHDDEVRAVLDEIVALPVALHEINADDLDRVIAEDAACAVRDASFKLAHRAGTDDHLVEIEFLFEFLLPLFVQLERPWKC